jgi:hypothetical protein
MRAGRITIRPYAKKENSLNPEYGGDGKKTGEGDKVNQPLIGFPGHWAPNDLFFYTGNQFPEHYKNGAFHCFSWINYPGTISPGRLFHCIRSFKNGAQQGSGKFLPTVLQAWTQ